MNIISSFILIPFLSFTGFIKPIKNTFEFEKIKMVLYGDPCVAPDYPIEYNQLDYYLFSRYSDISPYLVSEHRLYGLSSGGADPFYTSFGESVFIKYVSPGIYSSEGNCGIISTANALAYYKTHRNKTLFPLTSSTVNIIPQANATIFYYAVSHGYSPKSSNVALHTIYSKERDYAISLGYKVSGLNNSETEFMFESTCSYYGYSSSDYDGMTSCDKTVLMNELDNDRPVQIRTVSDSNYGNHGMMATGYKYFSVILYDEILDTYYQSFLLLVSVWDGSSSERWYDIPSCTSLPTIYSRATSVSLAKMIVL